MKPEFDIENQQITWEDSDDPIVLTLRELWNWIILDLVPVLSMLNNDTPSPIFFALGLQLGKLYEEILCIPKIEHVKSAFAQTYFIINGLKQPFPTFYNQLTQIENTLKRFEKKLTDLTA